jgi:hypothetical protein
MHPLSPREPTFLGTLPAVFDLASNRIKSYIRQGWFQVRDD